MNVPTLRFLRRIVTLGLMVILPLPWACAQSSSYRGLWVGQVTLNFVNEVTVPLDADNVPRAPDPDVPTPTSDAANLRLILHVNGAGQTSLLKDVAVLNRKAGTARSGSGTTANVNTNAALLSTVSELVTSDSDVALISDERLYDELPPQPAVRYASAVFDFGDSRASTAVNEVIGQAAEAAGTSVFNTTANLNTVAGRQTAESAATAAATTVAQPIVQNADVGKAFAEFIVSTNINSQVVNSIAAASDAAAATNAAQAALMAATNLQNQSFYSDSRAIEMVEAVLAATVDALDHGTNPTNAAQNAAASAADVMADYPRFISGQMFGDMIAAAADAAAQAATNAGASAATIGTAVQGNTVVKDTRAKVIDYKIPQYEDNRFTVALDTVLDVITSSAVDSLTNSARLYENVRSAADAAGRKAQTDQVPRYAVSGDAPTLDYDNFVRSSGFQTSANVAAQAAAQGAISERRNNALYTLDSVKGAAKAAAATALQSVQSSAALAVRSELPLTGSFGLGQGDPRLTWTIKQNNLAPLSTNAALRGTIYLPANHPTNPFRHRRHPDHQVGFDLVRKLRLDFDGQATNALTRAGYGVDRITGVYREEIFGLHKPLGPDPANAPIGLKVEGTFELNRVSLIDSLNAL